MNYQCLVMDHDDTVVRSAETVNYPELVQILKVLRPGLQVSFEAFTRGCFFKTFTGFCLEDLHYTQEELRHHYSLWKAYVKTHMPPLYPGIREILLEFRARGGIICVSSHSGEDNIRRDYRTLLGFEPDRIYSYELPAEQQKPSPYALEDIMVHYRLSPRELLMVDDMKSGLEMAQACSVPFACAGWSHNVPEIRRYMQSLSPVYLEQVEGLNTLLFGS